MKGLHIKTLIKTFFLSNAFIFEKKLHSFNYFHIPKKLIGQQTTNSLARFMMSYADG